MANDPQEMLPLKPVDFLVLLVLSDGERHGYGIVQDIEAETDGAVRMLPGNLYAVLGRLLRDGLVQESGRRPARDLDDERRRYYALTPLGRRVAIAEARRMEETLSMARAKNLIAALRPARGR